MPRITSKGQVTVPKRVRHRFGLDPGTEVKFEVASNMITLRKVNSANDLERWYGFLDISSGSDRFVASMRDEE